MKTRFVNRLRRHEAQATKHLGADGNADQRHPSVGIVAFAGRQHRRHDNRAGMDGAALERIVKILATARRCH